jgi:hypothetical protein
MQWLLFCSYTTTRNIMGWVQFFQPLLKRSYTFVKVTCREQGANVSCWHHSVDRNIKHEFTTTYFIIILSRNPGTCLKDSVKILVVMYIYRNDATQTITAEETYIWNKPKTQAWYWQRILPLGRYPMKCSASIIASISKRTAYATSFLLLTKSILFRFGKTSLPKLYSQRSFSIYK